MKPVTHELVQRDVTTDGADIESAEAMINGRSSLQNRIIYKIKIVYAVRTILALNRIAAAVILE